MTENLKIAILNDMQPFVGITTIISFLSLLNSTIL